MEQSVYDLRQEVAALRAMIDGDYPTANRWLATKVDRQRKVLDHLHSEAYLAKQARRAKALEEEKALV